MKQVGIVIAGIVILVLAVSLFSSGGSDSNTQITDSGSGGADGYDQLPPFSLEDYNGQTINSSEFDGKVLVVNTWATWCPFCVDELDDFAQVQKELGAQIKIIAINRSESLSKAKNFTDKLGVSNDILFLMDPSDSYYRKIGGFSMPETLIVDKDGNVVEHKRGPLSAQALKQKLSNIL